MNDVNKRLANLSPEKRELLLSKLKKTKKPSDKSAVINRREKQSEYPMSFGQKGFWFLDQLDPGSSLNNIPAAIKLSGYLHIPSLEKSLNEIIRRHEILRARFTMESGAPVQIVDPVFNLNLKIVDLSGMTEPEKDKRCRQLIDEEAVRPFNLAKGTLLRITLLRLSEKEHILLSTMHHIIGDAWSNGVFIHEVAALYEAFSNSKPSPLSNLPVQYFDYAHWQQKSLQGKLLDKQIAYWTKKLDGMASILELPPDKPRPPVQTYNGAHLCFELPENLSKALILLSKREKVTPFMLLLAAFQVLVHRYTGQKDISVGTPLANRGQRGTENLIGLFINIVVMRCNLDNDPSFLEILKQVRETALEAFSNNDLPFETLVKELHPKRELSRNPLFQVLFDYRNTPKQDLNVTGVKMSFLEVESGTVKFDLVLSMEDTPEGINGIFGYNIDLFEDSTIRRMTDHFRTILESITAAPHLPVSKLSILRDDERRKLLVDWNNTKTDYHAEGNQCIQQLFEKQAAISPDDTALIFCSNKNDKSSRLTFKELNSRANQLAHYLKKLGAGPDVLIGLCIERSIDMIIGLLGIFKAGAAYVPIDPAYPAERIDFIINDAGLSFLITKRHLSDKFKNSNLQLIILDSLRESISKENTINPVNESVNENLAYMIYTSGSTGIPKGVMITHKALVNHCLAMTAIHNLTPKDRMLQFISLSFDAAGEEIFPALTSGASLVLPAAASEISGYDLLQLCKEQQITILHLPAPVWHNFINYLSERNLNLPAHLKIVLAGGETPSIEKFHTAGKLAGQPINFLNVYGPTEATITSSYYKIALASKETFTYGSMPIGSPINNTKIYLLDDYLNPAPVGVPSEIYIGGIGLSRGYLNRPHLTAEKFIPDPFSKDAGARLYKTGDLARRLPNGEIVYSSRIDHQVKIRGFRIELGEIESALNRHEAVQQPAVLARDDVPGGKRLAAYIVPKQERKPKIEELRNYLKGKLPEYMLPAAYIFLDKMPLTATGKIDRQALPAPDADRPELQKDYTAPQTKLEKFLYQMWRDILGIEKIGIHDNFFELGGNSIQGATFVNRLQDELGEYVYIVAIYDAPTIAGLAEYLQKDYPAGAAKITGEDDRFAALKNKHRIDQSKIDQLRRIIKFPPPVQDSESVSHSKNPTAVFVLSSPRSGSTLTRAMLGGHPLLFAPPELQLLNYNNLQERKSELSGRDDFWLDGAIRALMELKHCQADEARQIMTEYENKNLNTKEFYRLMQEWLGERIFVDKTPNYALNMEMMRRAEEYFEDTLYIHLVRHPYGVIPSFEKAKLHVFYPPFFKEEHPFPGRELAELVWLISHQNILEFLKDIPQQRQHRLYYEDLVQKPQKAMEGVCNFLDIEFHTDLLDPQKDKEKKMTDGLNDLSKMLGDVRFHEHKGITADRAYNWKKNLTENYLGDITWDMVEFFGYDSRGELEKSGRKILTPIKAIAEGVDHPLSFNQQRLWFLDHLEPGSPFYNMPIAVRISGRLNVTVLEQSLNEIIKRHENLRTSFKTVDGKPKQDIDPHLTINLSIKNLAAIPQQEQTAEIQKLVTEEAQRPFDLSQNPLLRASLLLLDKNDHVFLLTMHHIISDGLSLEIFIKELTALYKAFNEGKPSPLPDLPVQYADFAHWQRQRLDGGIIESQLNYWKKKLAGSPPLLKLPTDRQRPKVQTFHGGRQFFTLPAELSKNIKALGQKEGTTLYAALLTAFYALLNRYSGQDDICIGTPVAGRSRKETEALIGFFVNTLALRGDLSGNPTFYELLKQVKNIIKEAFANQDAPFEKIVDALQLERSMSYTPLFQVMFSYQQAPAQSLEISGLTLEPMEVESGTAKFDLTLSMIEDGQDLRGMLEYNTDLFDRRTIEAMVRHFENLLYEITANPDQRLAFLPILSGAEQSMIIDEWNMTEAEGWRDVCFHSLFEAQVEKFPHNPAVVYENETITYERLNQRANQLARYLRKLGIGPDVLAGICMERSIDMIVGILGVLKAGGAYVPLDPAYPKERMAFILEDARVSALLSQEKLLGDLPGNHTEIICLDKDWYKIAQEYGNNLVNNSSAENAAYVIFTSGSTGKPKGVVIEHRSMLNLLTGLKQQIFSRYDGKKLRASLNAPIPFDASVQQLALLLEGHTLYIVPQEVRINAADLVSFIRKYRLDVFDCVPSQLKLLLSEGFLDDDKWMPAICLPGGEAIDDETWKKLAAAPKTDFYNMYGPSECTVDSTIFHINSHPAKPTIGRPLANVQIYILDQYLQIVPIGAAGELHISGLGMGRGYLNRPELTAKRFIPNPFSGKEGGRLYKSGDLARCLPDGNIEFLGRIDCQVKVRGFRIELGEIESVLKEHISVNDAVVIVREDIPDNKRITAYLTAEDESTPNISELRDFSKEKLPDYMLPAAFVWLETIPLLPNGKVDRKALPKPDITRPDLQSDYTAPGNEKEKILAEIWSELLGMKQVGIKDNFFELGGDSILIIQIIARANQKGLSITPKQLFEYPTIEGLAAAAGTVPVIHAEQGIITGTVKLTPIQKKFFEQNHVEAHHWNQAIMLEVKESLGPKILKQVVSKIIEHHDALRLRFKQTGGEWDQINAGVDDNIPFVYKDFSNLPVTEQLTEIEKEAGRLQASLNLEQGPIMRAAYFKRSAAESDRLLIIVHHLAVDGISWRILTEDIQIVYSQIAAQQTIILPPKSTSFQYWAEKLYEYAQSDALNSELQYWLNLSENNLDKLPVDYENGINDEASLEVVTVSLNEENTTSLLKEVPAVFNTQINDALLTALVRAYGLWTGKQKLTLLLEGHGREDIIEGIDISRTVGWFTSMFPVYLDLSGAVDPGEALKLTKEQLRQIPDKGVGFGLLRYLSNNEKTKNKLNTVHNPEITFNYLGQFDHVDENAGRFIPVIGAAGAERSLKSERQNLWDISGSINNGQLIIKIAYSKNFHKQATVEKFAGDYLDEIKLLIKYCQSAEAGGYTPSDFEDVELEEDEIDGILEELGE
jgi:amino acid adenylation domain-containing protein/non-ribosomal peptide synthase protein (TIGR01720 family)